MQEISKVVCKKTRVRTRAFITILYCMKRAHYSKRMLRKQDCVKFRGRIEGFHDAVRTPYAHRPGRHVGFFLNNKICFNFIFTLFEKIKLTEVNVLTLLFLWCN